MSKPPDGVETAEFRRFAAHCLELRLRGMTVRSIAEHLKSEPDLVEAGLRLLIAPLTPSTREDALRLELERLDAVLTAFYDRACKGSAEAWSVVREISNLRGKLLGIFGPQKAVVFTYQDAVAGPPPVQISFTGITSGTWLPPSPREAPPPFDNLEPGNNDRPD